jgi:hypothetical protein
VSTAHPPLHAIIARASLPPEMFGALKPFYDRIRVA